MAGIAYVNGRYRPFAAATVNIEDRGYQFGDGVYEVFYLAHRRLIDRGQHFARLRRSLHELSIALPVTEAALGVIIAELIRRNRVDQGLVYLQISRGVARRDHAFPVPAPRPLLVVTLRAKRPPPRDIAAWAAAAITLPDQRWGRCDVKSLNLLPNVLARQAARAAGAYEAILFAEDGEVTEGAASNVWIVDADGLLQTRQLDHHILPGCTRAVLLDHLAATGTPFREAAFTLQALRTAREIFLTSASSFVKPIIRLDGEPVGNGFPGNVATGLYGQITAALASPVV